ncbi:hypothetical protein SKAU_G00108410 [Synaphobranchus kaupii]|uniref:Uncharacterized protein n=1 Tax=Synaphobranchus kaupii TaxID=118154 RepID=A0A9Q1G0Q4_SYNKA|nr:hypothetical protein SKAU_G00108410 [Synaphobranchus kaupii]
MSSRRARSIRARPRRATVINGRLPSNPAAEDRGTARHASSFCRGGYLRSVCRRCHRRRRSLGGTVRVQTWPVWLPGSLKTTYLQRKASDPQRAGIPCASSRELPPTHLLLLACAVTPLSLPAESVKRRRGESEPRHRHDPVRRAFCPKPRCA